MDIEGDQEWHGGVSACRILAKTGLYEEAHENPRWGLITKRAQKSPAGVRSKRESLSTGIYLHQLQEVGFQDIYDGEWTGGCLGPQK